MPATSQIPHICTDVEKGTDHICGNIKRKMRERANAYSTHEIRTLAPAIMIFNVSMRGPVIGNIVTRGRRMQKSTAVRIELDCRGLAERQRNVRQHKVKHGNTVDLELTKRIERPNPAPMALAERQLGGANGLS